MPSAVGAATELKARIRSVFVQGIIMMSVMATNVLVARHWGATVRGEMATGSVLASIGASVGGLGMHDIVVWGFSRYSREVLLSWSRASIVSSLGVGVAAGLVAVWALKLGWGLGLLIGMTCPVTQAMRIQASILLSMARLGQFDIVRGAPLMLGLILLITFALTGATFHPLSALLIAPVMVLGILGMRTAGVRLLGPLRWPRGRALVLGLTSSMGGLVQTSLARIDILVVALLLNQAQAGIYAVSLAAAEAVLVAASALAFHALRAGALRRSETRMLLEALALTACLAVVGYAGLHVAAGLVLGPAFARIDLTFILLTPGTLSLAMIRIRWAAAIGRGLARRAAISMLIGVVLQTVLDILLVPKFGINGAAVASSIAYFLAAILMLLPTLYRLDGDPSDALGAGAWTMPGGPEIG